MIKLIDRLFAVRFFLPAVTVTIQIDANVHVMQNLIVIPTLFGFYAHTDFLDQLPASLCL